MLWRVNQGLVINIPNLGHLLSTLNQQETVARISAQTEGWSVCPLHGHQEVMSHSPERTPLPCQEPHHHHALPLQGSKP